MARIFKYASRPCPRKPKKLSDSESTPDREAKFTSLEDAITEKLAPCIFSVTIQDPFPVGTVQVDSTILGYRAHMALLVENDGVVVLALVTAEQFKNN